MEIHTALSAQNIKDCEKVILELRPHLKNENIWELYQKQMQEKYLIKYISEQNQTVSFIGYRIQNMFYSGKTLYIDDLCTLPEYQGKGYAKKLLTHITDIAKQESCKVVSLDSGHHRHQAHQLYLNQGFVISSHHFQQTLNK